MLLIISKMNQMDIIWMVIWFLSGLIVFQTRGGSKKLLSTLSFLLSVISILSLFQNETSIGEIVAYIGIGKITGIFTSLFYLVGANISRYNQFGEMSPRIFLYLILILVLWIILDSVFTLYNF